MTGEMKIGTREGQTSLRAGRCGKKLIKKKTKPSLYRPLLN
jgi:uncharacterized C2H2 Zn-finger protein